MSNVFVSAGSTFVSETFSNLLFSTDAKKIEADLDILETKAKDLLEEKGYLDLPLLIEELKIDSITALKVIKRMQAKGLIIPKDAV
jgi:DNA-binding MarR family transcriptional regulator